jgi:hypothetical protein
MMTEPKLSFFRRLSLALAVFWRTLVDSDFAGRARALRQGQLSPEAGTAEDAEHRSRVTPAPALLRAAPSDAALQLLGLLQQGGRLIDFIEEDVDKFSDAEIGAAARVVHTGCHKALHDHLAIQPVRGEQEGARITLEKGFDASAARPTGNVSGTPPFTGTLVHRGWRVTEIKLPKITEGHDVSVLAPAEVEI